jgi:hypothetical protein
MLVKLTTLTSKTLKCLPRQENRPMLPALGSWHPGLRTPDREFARGILRSCLGKRAANPWDADAPAVVDNFPKVACLGDAVSSSWDTTAWHLCAIATLRTGDPTLELWYPLLDMPVDWPDSSREHPELDLQHEESFAALIWPLPCHLPKWFCYPPIW